MAHEDETLPAADEGPVHRTVRPRWWRSEETMDWQPIGTAPTDGRPVWVKGDNYGNPMDGQHRCWAWWDGHSWREAGAGEDIELLYLVSWLPTSVA